MNAWILAAIGTVLSVVLKTHLTIAAAGLVISVSLPLALLIAVFAASVIGLWFVFREVRGSRSSPYPRPVARWST